MRLMVALISLKHFLEFILAIAIVLVVVKA